MSAKDFEIPRQHMLVEISAAALVTSSTAILMSDIVFDSVSAVVLAQSFRIANIP